MCGWWQSPPGGKFGPSTRLLSLVTPQPMVKSGLNTGMRISSRIEGTPTRRTSPDWPPLQKP